MQQTTLLFCIISTSFLVGCEKLSFNSAKCNSEDTRKLVIELINKDIDQLTSEQVKTLINTQNITLDMGKVRSTIKQFDITVNDVRTNNSDPNSNKQYCVTEFIVKLPEQLVKDADAAREIYGESNVTQSAVLADLSFEMNQLKKDIDYLVQPTDSGDKVFVTLENSEALAYFVRDIAVDSLIKNARQNAVEVAKQEALQAVADQEATAKEYQSVLVDEAKAKVDTANENLNLVWNATTKEIRDQLLDEQRIWLKKRELECKLESTNVDNSEVARLNCEATMTNQRVNELRQKIYYLE